MGDGPPRFPQDFSCPAVLGIPSPPHPLLPTGLLPSMDRLSRTIRLGSAAFRLVPQPPTCRSSSGLGYFRFARRYSGNRDCFLFLRVLRCFTSPSLLLSPMYSEIDDPVTGARFPHSDTPGSKLACSSPRLIAACRVLLRLFAPRHPPSTLSSLT